MTGRPARHAHAFTQRIERLPTEQKVEGSSLQGTRIAGGSLLRILFVKFCTICLLTLLSSVGFAIGPCGGFRDCYDRGAEARERGNLAEAYSIFSLTCETEVPRVYGGFRVGSCQFLVQNRVELGKELETQEYFGSRCTKGSDHACYFLGIIQEEDGQDEAAMATMRSLCRKKFGVSGVSVDPCQKLKYMKRQWKANHPRPARTGPPQIAAFLVTLLLPIVALVLFGISLRKNRRGLCLWTLCISVAGLFVYGFYEYGVPSHAAIRIDMLLILPLLGLNLVLIVSSLVRLARGRF